MKVVAQGRIVNEVRVHIDDAFQLRGGQLVPNVVYEVRNSAIDCGPTRGKCRDPEGSIINLGLPKHFFAAQPGAQEYIFVK